MKKIADYIATVSKRYPNDGDVHLVAVYASTSMYEIRTLTHENESLKAEVQRLRSSLAPGSEFANNRHFAAILQVVCEHYGVTEAMLVKGSRVRSVARARLAAYYIARTHGFSYPEIGRYFNRDHTTVMQGAKSFERGSDRVEVDELVEAVRVRKERS